MRIIRSFVVAAVGAEHGRFAAYRQLAIITALFMTLVLSIAGMLSGFWLISLTAAFAVMPALMGVNVLFGQLGLVSLSQYALVGVGGWTALWLFHTFQLPFTPALVASGVAASVVGVVWGLPALRFRGIYLALVTLMLAGAFQAFINAKNFPVGGSGGLERVLLDRPSFAASDAGYMVYTGVVCLIGLLTVELHRRSKPGRTWALIRKSPRLAQASGASIVLYQTWAFALAGFLAGIAGALLAGLYRQLDSTGFGASESILLFAASIIGGTTNWLGTVIGALLIRVVPAFFDTVDVSASVSLAVFGAALIAAVVFGPSGLAGLIDELADRFSRSDGARSGQREGGHND